MPVAVTLEERPVRLILAVALAPETAILRPVLPAVAAVEVDESDRMLPLVRPLAERLKGVCVVAVDQLDLPDARWVTLGIPRDGVVPVSFHGLRG